MKNYTLAAICLLLSSVGFAQQPTHPCLFDEINLQRHAENPRYMGDLRAFYEDCKEHRGQQRTNEVLYIPVVFHVVWNSESQNVPDSVIFNQLNILNQDYRRNNPDADLTREVFLPVAADTEIEFYLAGNDPEGNPSNGINRVETDRTGFELNLFDIGSLDEVKHAETDGADAWDPEHYVNIWICNIESSLFGQVFGFAYPPNNSPNWPEGQGASEIGNEGIVVHYTTVGNNNPAANEDGFTESNGGRTLSHEMGHYLGLRHIWGDAIPFFEDGCDVDDGIDDTPNVEAGSNYTCDPELESCEEGEDALPAMIENYMDYNQDACLNMFTQEQADMMRYIIEEYRPGLLEGDISVGLPVEPDSKKAPYPNPFVDVLNLGLISSENQQVDIEILCPASGQILYQGTVSPGEDRIDLSHLASGIYILNIHENETIQSHRLIKL